MARPWIRLYTDVPNNPKVQRLSPALFKFWVNCLCLAGQNDGALPTLGDLAWTLKMKPIQAADALNELAAAGLLELSEGIYLPHDWSELQYETDTSTERVKRFRERNMKRDEAATSNGLASVSVSESVSASGSEEIKRDQRKSDPRDLWFEEWWAEYWLKNAKKAAKTAYFKAVTGESMRDSLLAAIRAQSPGMLAREPRVRPHGATWINGSRWDDEPEIPPTATPRARAIDLI